ncbi:MAG: ATP-binding protein [Chloroflexota bacterium]
MPQMSIPSRFEPLQEAFGDSRWPTVLIRTDSDIDLFKRLAVKVRTARQGKLVFLYGESGSGKTTICASLRVFLPDDYAQPVFLPPPWELPHDQIPAYISANFRRKPDSRIQIVAIDRREMPELDDVAFKRLLTQINGLLRTRPDLLLIWPVTDEAFAKRAADLLVQCGGHSALTGDPIIRVTGVQQRDYHMVLERMLNVMAWDLADAAVTWGEVDQLASQAASIGAFLDSVQRLVAERTELPDNDIKFPTLVIALSSDGPIQQVCSQLRRANSYYIEGARLLQETRESNAAEWWLKRRDERYSLPFVIGQFQAQLVSLTPTAVVAAAGLHGGDGIKPLVARSGRTRSGAVKSLMATEFYRYFTGQGDGVAPSGARPTLATLAAYQRVRDLSETRHLEINRAIVTLALDAGLKLGEVTYEERLTPRGLRTDAALRHEGHTVALEFHHKSKGECTPNKVAIYLLEKLKVYAIDYGLATP